MSAYLNKGIAKRPKRNKQSTPRDASMWTPAWGGGNTGTHGVVDCSVLLFLLEIGDFLLKDRAKTLVQYVKVRKLSAKPSASFHRAKICQVFELTK